MCEITSLEDHKNKVSGKGLIAKLTKKAEGIEAEVENMEKLADKLSRIDADIGIGIHSQVVNMIAAARGYRIGIIELRRMYRD